MERSFLLLLDEVDIHLHPLWQRKVLPIVQRLFPNAQIIASTHSPFVVASVADAQIIGLGVQRGVATVEQSVASQDGESYTAILRGLFSMPSDFGIEVERALLEFEEARDRFVLGQVARSEVDRLAFSLAQRSEELRELVTLELLQMDRQLARRKVA